MLCEPANMTETGIPISHIARRLPTVKSSAIEGKSLNIASSIAGPSKTAWSTNFFGSFKIYFAANSIFLLPI